MQGHMHLTLTLTPAPPTRLQGHMHMIDDPLIKTLLTSKWQRFARAQFLAHAGVYLVLMLVQTFLVWLHSDAKLYNSYHRTVGAARAQAEGAGQGQRDAQGAGNVGWG